MRSSRVRRGSAASPVTLCAAVRGAGGASGGGTDLGSVRDACDDVVG